MHQVRSGERGKRILIVDDEPNVRETVAINLRREGLDVEFASDGLQAIEKARSSRPDVVVLDIMLPGIDGFQVCRTIREESTVPILLLSARGEEIDRVVGLELGADDFLVKPFAMSELVARVRAMLRRAKMVGSTNEHEAAENESRSGAVSLGTGATSDRRQPDSGSIESGDVSIDIRRRHASVAGEPIDLKPKEFDLLAYFVRQPGIVLTREALLREVWGYNYPVDTRTVDVHVRWLRQKIEENPSQPIRIVTVRGHGYRFVSHVGG